MHSLFPSDDEWKNGVLDRVSKNLVPCEPLEPLCCDRWIATSVLQKAIRRGEYLLAQRAAFVLSAHSRSYTWRRLMVIAFEDVGAAEIDAVVETVAIATTSKWRSRYGEKECLAHVVTRLAGALKDRSADYLICTAGTHPCLNEARETCRRSNLDGRLRVVEDSSQPLALRALATWLSSGVDGRDGLRTEDGSLIRLARLFSHLGVRGEFLASMILAAKRTREPITVLVPLIWLASQGDRTTKVCNGVIPESPSIYGIPMYAFDKHTRLGQAAIQKLTQESHCLRACLKQHFQKEIWRKAVQMAAFYTDGYLIRHRLDWSMSQSLEALGIESDFGHIGVPDKAVGPLRSVMRDELGLLNEIRSDLWRNSVTADVGKDHC